MYCKHCGNELKGSEDYCEVCGKPLSDNNDVNQGQYLSFEYARTTVQDDMVQAAMDCYESLGFELTGQRSSTPGSHRSTLSFRRSRKVSGKAQLAKIQRTMDDTMTSIEHLEKERTKKATIQALVIGIISALVLGIGMCCTMVWQNLMVIGIVIGIVGIAGCVAAYLRYRSVCSAETSRLNPEIEAAYDRLATLCEEAQAVLRGKNN